MSDWSSDGCSADLWAGWLVKADTPDAEVARLQAALTKALADPKVIAAIRASGSDIAKPLSTAQADAFYTDQTKLFRKIVSDNHISVEIGRATCRERVC